MLPLLEHTPPPSCGCLLLLQNAAHPVLVLAAFAHIFRFLPSELDDENHCLFFQFLPEFPVMSLTFKFLSSALFLFCFQNIKPTPNNSHSSIGRTQMPEHFLLYDPHLCYIPPPNMHLTQSHPHPFDLCQPFVWAA